MLTNARARLDLLQTLYRARESKPDNGWVIERAIKDAHGYELIEGTL